MLHDATHRDETDTCTLPALSRRLETQAPIRETNSLKIVARTARGTISESFALDELNELTRILVRLAEIRLFRMFVNCNCVWQWRNKEMLSTFANCR